MIPMWIYRKFQVEHDCKFEGVVQEKLAQQG